MRGSLAHWRALARGPLSAPWCTTTLDLVTTAARCSASGAPTSTCRHPVAPPTTCDGHPRQQLRAPIAPRAGHAHQPDQECGCQGRAPLVHCRSATAGRRANSQPHGPDHWPPPLGEPRQQGQPARLPQPPPRSVRARPRRVVLHPPHRATSRPNRVRQRMHIFAPRRVAVVRRQSTPPRQSPNQDPSHPCAHHWGLSSP